MMAKGSRFPKRQRGLPAWRIVFWMVIFAFIGGVAGYQWKVSRNAGPRAGEIRDFVGTYFKTWSSRDMEGYAACFDPAAMIYFIENGKIVLRQDKPDFIAGQTMAVNNGPAMSEHAESIEIVAEGDMAYVLAHWKLTKGNVIKYGYDHFVLLRKSQGWQIVTLSFYEIKE